MTLREIESWIKSAKFIVTDYCDGNSEGNIYTRDIFEKDGKHFAIEYINGEIVPVIDGKKKETTYQLKEVKVTPETIDRGVIAIIV